MANNVAVHLVNVLFAVHRVLSSASPPRIATEEAAPETGILEG
jgi:hypothetical protein